MTTITMRIKKIVSITLLSVMLIASLMVVLPTAHVEAATTTNLTPITAYIRGYSNVRTYTGINGTATGWIYPSDRCTILNVYSSGWVKVKYPVSRGTRTAYTPTSNFFANVDFDSKMVKSSCRKNVFGKPNLSYSLGTVYSTDNIIVIGSESGNTQIIYPVDGGGYKCGFVSGTIGEGGGTSNIKDGYYKIQLKSNPKYVFDIYGASTSDCANLQLYHDLGAAINQIFYISKNNDGSYKIKAIHSGKVIDIEGGVKNLIQYTDQNSSNQKWLIQINSDGSCSFKSQYNGNYIDLEQGIVRDEQNISTYPWHGADNQRFLLSEVSVNGSGNSSGEDRIEAAVHWAIATGNDQSHGYSQVQNRRWGSPDYDCSSFVISAFRNAGFNLSGATYTQNMRSTFQKEGFRVYSASELGLANGYGNLKRGDILLNDSSDPSVQHTEIYMGNGQIIGAHQSYGHREEGDQSNEVGPCGYYYHPWTCVLRYEGN